MSKLQEMAFDEAINRLNVLAVTLRRIEMELSEKDIKLTESLPKAQTQCIKAMEWIEALKGNSLDS